MTRRTRDRLGVVPAMLVIGLLGCALWSTTSLAQTPGCVPIDQNKLRLRKIGDTGTGNERILFRGIFDVDAAAVLDPVSNASGTVWTWRDRDAQVSGLKRLVLKRHGSEARIALFGQELDFPLPTLPITIRVVIPDAGGGAATCGEEAFPETECFFRNQGNKLTCRTEGGRRPID
jgi:hypothetical protein